jgi:enamine deaminase RidA (YjgF/YER057c/UK114 family)
VSPRWRWPRRCSSRRSLQRRSSASLARRSPPSWPEVALPPGTSVVYLSGQVPAPADAAKPADSIEAYGDTKTQAIGVLEKIKGLLASQGLGLGDVVKLSVFLVGDPKKGGKLDFKGFSEAYSQFFGTSKQPNLVARTTVQVAALANPGFLVEIEATAAKVRP